MPMDEEFRFVFFHKFAECTESLVRQITSVVKLVGRSMCKQDIESAMPKKREPEFPDPPPHLAFCILVDSRLVAHGSSEPEDPHALINVNAVFDADTALRGTHFVLIIMVAADIEDRGLGKSDQKRKIIWVEIPRR
jgi:hypothetical protein